MTQLTGTSNYEGPSVGQCSFYRPLAGHSEYVGRIIGAFGVHKQP